MCKDGAGKAGRVELYGPEEGVWDQVLLSSLGDGLRAHWMSRG